jgi:hypothetical protein
MRRFSTVVKKLDVSWFQAQLLRDFASQPQLRSDRLGACTIVEQ